MNKSGQGSPLYRGGGSIAFTAAARSVLMAGPHPKQSDPDDPIRVLAGVKCNLCRMPQALEYRMVDSGKTAAIEWIGGSDVEAWDLCNPERDKDGPSKIDEAEEFLKAELAEEAIATSILQTTARNIGISWVTLKRAKATFREKRMMSMTGLKSVE